MNTDTSYDLSSTVYKHFTNIILEIMHLPREMRTFVHICSSILIFRAPVHDGPKVETVQKPSAGEERKCGTSIR